LILYYIAKYAIGAIITGNTQLAANEILHVAVGQKGKHDSSGNGGTFVIKDNRYGSFTPIVIAGGAGAASNSRTSDSWCNAQLEEYGNGSRGRQNNDIGNDGKSGCTRYFTGGSGYKENRCNVTDLDPKCFTGGLHGGRDKDTRAFDGGFGGGGLAGNNGGGGGYTGGNGSWINGVAAGGGGSYNIDPNGTAKLGWYHAGQCKIKFIK